MITLIFNSILLGTGLAMDAFSVSLANGLGEPCMKKRKMLGIASIFAAFQGVMPLIGWVCIHTLVNYFKAFEKFIPWIALILLCYIGSKMVWDALKGDDSEESKAPVGLTALLVQGIATSIDALSVGFTISEHNFIEALVACFLIGAVTFVICFSGIAIGKKAGTKLAGKAGILGGAILIFIGLEIFITSFFG